MPASVAAKQPPVEVGQAAVDGKYFVLLGRIYVTPTFLAVGGVEGDGSVGGGDEQHIINDQWTGLKGTVIPPPEAAVVPP
jgi:hypothetical protein